MLIDVKEMITVSDSSGWSACLMAAAHVLVTVACFIWD